MTSHSIQAAIRQSFLGQYRKHVSNFCSDFKIGLADMDMLSR